ncbi:MAG: hypothetical protein Q4D30_06220 [Bacteroidales bacterium]|nr:hypothetical protein [Bacteroidales bacterium]
MERLPKKGNTIVAELEKEFNEDITRVGKTFSAIELVHFCSNSDADELWESLGLPRSRGTITFWHFIVPMIYEIQRHVGCQYLFLFAADDSRDERLVNYYRDQLNFSVSTSLATAKPVYDFTCKFMFQEISELKQAQKDFFEHFNPDEA